MNVKRREGQSAETGSAAAAGVDVANSFLMSVQSAQPAACCQAALTA